MFSPPYDLVLSSARVLTPAGERAGWVGVRDGEIAAVEVSGAARPAGIPLVELDADEALLPGLVDTHVHVNEPGRTEWEGFASATRAAAAGGVTTVIDMPLNSIPPTLDVRALLAKQACATGVVQVDTGFWGGAVPANVAELAALHAAGVLGFKCFLVPSGVDEFPALGGERLVAAMAEVARLGALLVVHAEDEAALAAAPPASGRRYSDYLASRPIGSETVAVAELMGLVERTGARTHVVHVSSGAAAELIGAARRRGVPISGETCPHYLTLAAEDVPDGATAYKCCPPIRDRAEQDRLWAALDEGALTSVVSDHSPCPPDLKRLERGDFGDAWGGIASVQLGLPVVWTAARRRGVALGSVVRWMASAPADLVGLTGKGRIEVGADADFVAFAPDETWTVDPAALHHRHAVTPYAGRELTGVVRRTWLRGAETDPATPRGRLLRRASP